MPEHMLHKYFPSQFIWEVFFHARISSQPLFHLKNPAMQDFYRSFNRDCELVSQLPTINMVLCMKNFLMVFDQIMALTKGGPAQSTESISYLIYNNGMSGGQFGFQSANAVIFFIVIVVISVAQMKFTGSKEEQL